MTKPLHKMTNYELRDELQRKREREQMEQHLLVAAYNKVHQLERTIDNAFYKHFKPLKQQA